VAAAAAVSAATAAKRPFDPLTPGVKITLQIPTGFTGEDLTFAQTARLRRGRHQWRDV